MKGVHAARPPLGILCERALIKDGEPAIIELGRLKNT
jgi:hypothetical protein